MEESIGRYLDDLYAKLPAPGGGSVSALSGALAVSLLGMVLNFTIGNPRYSDFEAEAKDMLKYIRRIKKRLSVLIDKDVESYNQLREAYRLPKENDAQKRSRSRKIQKALIKAMLVPLEVCKLCSEAVRICPKVARFGNKNLISDVAIPIWMLEASFFSARVNVILNQHSISDRRFRSEVKRQIDSYERVIRRYRSMTLQYIDKFIKGVA